MALIRMFSFQGFSLIVGIALVLGVFGAMTINAETTGTWRYRITVNVETPEGIKSGSAVREVNYRVRRNGPTDERGNYYTIGRGEAVVVDLGERGKLFGLMCDDGGDVEADIRTVFSALPAGSPLGTLATLNPKQYPMFVHMRDMNDPRTMEAVSPTATADKQWGYGHDVKRAMESVYGAGVKIHSVTLEATSDPPTVHIESDLKWLPRVLGHYLSGKDINRDVDGTLLYEWLDSGVLERKPLR